MTQAPRQIASWSSWLALAVVVAAAVACAPEGNDSTLTLQLTAVGSLPAGAESLSVTVQSVAVHVADSGAEALAANDTSLDGDGRWHSVAVGKSATLTGNSAPLVLGSTTLPVGVVNQIRLNLAPVAGLIAKPAGCTLDLSATSAKGWRLTKPFKPFATYRGVSHVGTLGIDLATALLPQGDCYQLQPALGVASWQTAGHFLAVE